MTSAPWDDDLAELHARLTRGIEHLRKMSHVRLDTGIEDDAVRLAVKAEGMRAALTYVEEMQRIKGTREYS